MHRVNVGWLAAVAGCGIGVACGGTTEVITPPPPPPTDFVIEFRADTGDAATVRSLGWPGGIPDVEVAIRPEDTTKGGSLALRGTTQGRLVLNGASPGSYVIDASRWLTTQEMAKLASGDDALGFVTKQVIRVAPGEQASVPLFGSRRRGLVISEWAFNQKGDYYYGGFLELFNNADTTVYLDGLVIGEGWWASLDVPTSPCSENAPYRNDSQGIWTREFWRFPGTGREYPVSSGRAVVIATDAIDHRPFLADGLDLSRADFETIGTSDADNPAVRNMENVGTTGELPHGATFFFLVSVPYLALPFDPNTLVRVRPSGGKEWGRVPADRILDAFAIGTNYLAGFPDCPPLVHHRFDRHESRVRGSDGQIEYSYSLSRKRLPGSSTTTLQHSRSGHSDFARTARSPGTIP